LAAAAKVGNVPREVPYEWLLARAIARGDGEFPQRIVGHPNAAVRERNLFFVAEGYARAYNLPRCRAIMKRLEVRPINADEMYQELYPKIAELFFEHGEQDVALEVLNRIPSERRDWRALALLARVHLKAGNRDAVVETLRQPRSVVTFASQGMTRDGGEEQLRAILDQLPPQQRFELCLGVIDGATGRWPRL
jgi:hypothetical protein